MDDTEKEDGEETVETPVETPVQEDSLDDLVDDLDGSAAPAAGEKDETEEPAGEPAKEPAKEPATPAATPAAEEKFTFRGQEYTYTEAVKAGVWKQILTRAEQASAYHEELEQRRRQDKEAAEKVATKPEDVPVTPETFVKKHQPKIDELVNAGWVSKDFAEFYPAEVAAFIELQQKAIPAIEYFERVKAGQEAQAAGARKAEAERVFSFIDTTVEELSKSGEAFYAGLGDESTRVNFLKHLIRLNPHKSQITRDFIEGEWAHFNRQVVKEAVNSHLSRAEQEAQRQRARAAGESPTRSVGGGRLPPAGDDGLDDLLEGMEPPRR